MVSPVCVLLFALVAGITSDVQASNVHEAMSFRRWDGLRVRQSGHRQLKLSTTAAMSCHPSTVQGLAQTVNVSFSGVQFASKYDWIGVWPNSANLTLFSAPIKFKYAYPYNDPPPGGFTPASGWATFDLHTMREPVFFAYLSGNKQYPQLIARTDPVSFAKPNMPFGVHLALGAGGDPTQMRVYWSVGTKYSQARVGVKFATVSANGTGWYKQYAPAFASPGRQYTAQDMCDRDVQPAGRQGWIQPSVLLDATLTNLLPGTRYYYSYGDDDNGWSTELSFVTPPAIGPTAKTVVATFGDMGQAERDGAFHHSWDFGDRGEYPAINTTDSLHSDPSLDLVLHIGDISYAVGYLAEWDNFFWQIEPVASRLPWMTTIGNHEQGWSQSFYNAADSGGECGVCYNAHFPFASQDPESKQPFSKRQPWYAFSHGSVAYVHMSTEHDFTPGSAQHTWISKALAAVNRTLTPWLVFTGHRPMYVASEYAGGQAVAAQLRAALEDLLVKYKVDLALWGHNHSMQWFCSGLYNNTCGQANGVQHAVIGMAGYEHTKCPATLPSIVQQCNDDNWGYTRLTFNGTATAKLDFLSNGKLVNTFSIQQHD